VAEFSVVRDGVSLAGEEAGEGVGVVGLHGLTATRRYVVMGSRSLERTGHRVVLYDARGHGASSPAGLYDYPSLAADLGALLDDRGMERAVLVGASMGAHTIARFALESPERVAAAVLVTPAFDPEADPDLARWDRLSAALRHGGVEGFVAAYGVQDAPEEWQPVIARVLRQRLGAHEHPEAVADALSAVPRSRPFEAWEDLGALAVPAVVVGDSDEADPEHPLAVARRWCEALPDARLVMEEAGKSPIAWQGGQLSRVVAELAAGVA
jgi:pimeloyl-ACP methyl ester carboxylesterase